ncbi:hypothetical protein T492DRAFT_1075094 [Pavlovales sp. CCMP2436]|nr:hypothetical protein T492DRAFT_1075094 [Pavlovales sp. CCMP2436]
MGKAEACRSASGGASRTWRSPAARSSCAVVEKASGVPPAPRAAAAKVASARGGSVPTKAPPERATRSGARTATRVPAHSASKAAQSPIQPARSSVGHARPTTTHGRPSALTRFAKSAAVRSAAPPTRGSGIYLCLP